MCILISKQVLFTPLADEVKHVIHCKILGVSNLNPITYFQQQLHDEIFNDFMMHIQLRIRHWGSDLNPQCKGHEADALLPTKLSQTDIVYTLFVKILERGSLRISQA